jgi:ketosteroid isomerase-like protein
MTKMIKVASVLVAVFALAAWQSTQAAEKGSKSTATGSGDEATIMKLTEKIREAALKGDVSTFQELYADDFLSISAVTGTPSTKGDAINNFKSGKLKYETLTTSDLAVHFYGPSTALVTNKTEAKGTLDGKDLSGTYRTARLWVKRGGKWQVVFFQSTNVPSQVRTG